MKIIIYILQIFIFSSLLLSRQTSIAPGLNLVNRMQSEAQIFNDLETSIKKGDVNSISKYFGQQTFFSLSNGISGYYSSNQAFYVLEDFFKLYKVTSFRFDHVKTDKNNSYATGKYNYDNKGKRNIAQVYVSLKKVGNSWNITQLTIN